MAASNESAVECLNFLLKVSHDLFATHEVEKLLAEITDAFVTLSGAERGYLLFCEAGPKNLLPVCARGAGGLTINPPERRIIALAGRALSEPGQSTVLIQEDGRGQAAAVLTSEGKNLAVAVVDGSLKPAWTQSKYLDVLARNAGLALENARFFERASNDLLTGLPNHSFFDGALSKLMRREDLGSDASGMLLIDLDTFKRVNQAAGADVGDRALTDVAHTLRDTLSADGLVARYGSDKFAILLVAGPEKSLGLRLRDVAERARAAVGAKIFSGVQLSCCIGGLPLPPYSEKVPSSKDLVGACDRILAQARKRGTGQVEIGVFASDFGKDAP